MSKRLNPVGFTPWPVTIISTLIYAALIVSLLVVHMVVPPAPRNPAPENGINLTEAWADLQVLTNGFHPYNSRRNDEVRDWLLKTIEKILDDNGLDYIGVGSTPERVHNSSSGAVIFNDMLSNVTFSSGGRLSSSGRYRDAGQSVYFEGTNIIVYIRGELDDEGWWLDTDNAIIGEQRKTGSSHGVLVNSHYDSVSTGFGATDDGVGTITLLQLIKYFSTHGNTPKKGFVALFNNGEEDFLNGARAFTQHPASRFVGTFVNLEGAGAGGRATLFRSTDTEVTKSYGRSPYPFGSVVSADGFKRGLVRSQTDYIVFDGTLGLRGLDVAFMEPRARYHTDQDDTKHTSMSSLWHMLSAALATTKGLTADTSGDAESTTGNEDTNSRGKQGSEGVWFDLYGRSFVAFRLRTLFALSVSLLVVTPLILLLVGLLLHRKERLYFFATKAHRADGDPLPLHGLRGISRFPLILVVSFAIVVALAFLLAKVNPMIAYSSSYAVWTMMASLYVAVTWFLLSGAQFVRSSALYRGYALLWMYLLGWILLVAATVLEDRFNLAGSYFVFFFFCAVFLAAFLTLVECAALPRISEYAESQAERPDDLGTSGLRRTSSVHSSTLIGPSEDEAPDEEATETTPLFRGDRPSFAHYGRPDIDPVAEEGNEPSQNSVEKSSHVFGDEQAFSASLPSFIWLLQLIILAPFHVVLVGQIALLLTSAMNQTTADGNDPLLFYLAIALLTGLIFLPLQPFLHRVTAHIPIFLALVFTGTLIYNLTAFPFSATARLKVYFLQSVDLDTGLNTVSLTGVPSYIHQIASSIPSTAGKPLNCSFASRGKSGLQTCSWPGLAPRTVPSLPPTVPPELGYADWLHFNVSRGPGLNEALFQLYGRNTRACKLVFTAPIADFHVVGAGTDPRFDAVPPGAGSNEIRLWRREWERPWDVMVKWNATEGRENEGEGRDGKVVCLWSDANQRGVIPALDEVWRFAPEWVAVTKMADGLVEGEKNFVV
ncbi:MAG: hypothetical protein M1833_000551 [Piccolia ochrophora]|nr:MAG: hypothetical protein M1833_000551 [Piccolia ochrophora]